MLNNRLTYIIICMIDSLMIQEQLTVHFLNNLLIFINKFDFIQVN
jgi:hypothetical protein